MTATRYVDYFGIELEGGWDEYPPARDQLRRDGSVDCDGRTYVGECTSDPFQTLADGLHWIEQNYPDHRSQSCGLHVHMSFSPQKLCVSYLADSEDYWFALRQDLETWGKQRNVKRQSFYSRLKGENSYCSTGDWKVDSEQPLRDRGAERYKAVNFASLNKHGTVEIRVLPMFSSASLAVGAVSTVLAATDNYLSQCFSNGELNELVERTAEVEMVPPETVIVAPFDPFEAGRQF